LTGLSLNVGDTVSTGTSAGTIITTEQIADLSLDEVDAAKVAAGQKATLTFDAIQELSLAGTVANVSALGTVTQGVVSYEIKVALDTQDPRIKAGMTVNADIQTAVHQNVLTVPSSAIKTQGTQSYVQVFAPPIANTGGTTGVVSTVPPTNVIVTTGISDTLNTEILSGLTAGEQIVTKTTGSAATAAVLTTSASSARGGGGGGLGGGAAIRL
jgi:multidrug efflux pump subunit AcrA (membrane-fusion protein)